MTIIMIMIIILIMIYLMIRRYCSNSFVDDSDVVVYDNVDEDYDYYNAVKV